jgi:hypothetical protein
MTTLIDAFLAARRGVETCKCPEELSRNSQANLVRAQEFQELAISFAHRRTSDPPLRHTLRERGRAFT